MQGTRVVVVVVVHTLGGEILLTATEYVLPAAFNFEESFACIEAGWIKPRAEEIAAREVALASEPRGTIV